MNWREKLRANLSVAWDFLAKRALPTLLYGTAILVCFWIGTQLYQTFFKPAQPPIEQWNTAAPEPKETVKIKRIYVKGPERIRTIEKTVVVEKMKLPDDVAKNPDVEVIATAEVMPHKGKTDVVATMNTKTGEGNIITRQRKPDFFEFTNEKEIGIRYGVGTQGVAADVFARWDVVRIGPANVGIYTEAGATGTGKAQAKAQISISHKW